MPGGTGAVSRRAAPLEAAEDPFVPIRAAVADHPGSAGRRKPGINVVPFGAPTHRVTTVEPVITHRPYGFGRRVTTIDFGVDEPQRFDERLALLGMSGSDGCAAVATAPGRATRPPAGGGARGGTTSRNGR